MTSRAAVTGEMFGPLRPTELIGVGDEPVTQRRDERGEVVVAQAAALRVARVILDGARWR